MLASNFQSLSLTLCTVAEQWHVVEWL